MIKGAKPPALDAAASLSPDRSEVSPRSPLVYLERFFAWGHPPLLFISRHSFTPSAFHEAPLFTSHTPSPPHAAALHSLKLLKPAPFAGCCFKDATRTSSPDT